MTLTEIRWESALDPEDQRHAALSTGFFSALAELARSCLTPGQFPFPQATVPSNVLGPLSSSSS